MAKRFLSAIIAVVLIVLSTVCVYAVETEDVLVSAEPDIQVLGDTFTLKDDQVMYTTYNISENHRWGISLRNNEIGTITRMFRDCVDDPQIIDTVKGATYNLWICDYSGASGSQKVDFATTGGEYVKVRGKLSTFSDYFNADGSHTKGDHTYYFGDVEYVDDDRYSAGLAIVSGGVINGVAPDKDGFVEFYVCTDMNASTRYFTDYSYYIVGGGTGGGGGTNGASIPNFKIGSVDGDYGVYIKDATKVQMYATKLMKFDDMQKFRADVDRDGIVNIVDATKIQLYVAGYKY